MVGGTPIPSKEIVAVLSKLRARNGVFGVLGNHDWWGDDRHIRREFAQHNIKLLEDAAEHIKIGAGGLWIAGVSDFVEGAHDVNKALSTVTGDNPIILFTHSPDIFPDVPSRVALTLAGHTHGGQVYVPFLGRPIVPSIYGQSSSPET